MCCAVPCRAVLQVIDLISLKPFDMETISKSIKKTRKALIVEECMKTGGIGASLSAVINESLFDELDHQVRSHYASHMLLGLCQRVTYLVDVMPGPNHTTHTNHERLCVS